MPDLLTLTIPVRRALQRPVLRRAAVAVLALATGLAVWLTFRAAESGRHGWGEPRIIAVAQRDLEPGRPVEASGVALRPFPDALVPAGALDVEPVGAVVRHPIAAGEPLVEQRLAPYGVSGLAAVVPDGHRAVAVPGDRAATPPLQPGDVVDVLVVLPPGDLHGHPAPEIHPDPAGTAPEAGKRQTEPAFPLVTGARVIDAADQSVTVTVPTPDAPRLAYALAAGVVMLTLTGD